jgi:hypothetical protein
MVPHTHDDVGWRKTFEEYFSGSAVLGDERTAVQYILDTVVDELERNPQRTFTYVEMKYFNMWYNLLTAQNKERVKKLVKKGQLEIAQGGWTASDEACPNY